MAINDIYPTDQWQYCVLIVILYYNMKMKKYSGSDTMAYWNGLTYEYNDVKAVIWKRICVALMQAIVAYSDLLYY